MTMLVYRPLHENMTASEHRQATVRWAWRAAPSARTPLWSSGWGRPHRAAGR